MFHESTKRYHTKRIAEELHPEITMNLWNLIYKRRKEGEKLDYLQVFELSIQQGAQVVNHKQEQPSYEEKWVLSLKYTHPVLTKIWCIDDGENQVMMYPSEY